jgi:hypothetical protein
MSLLKANSVQIGQSTTGTNNFTLSVPSSPDGTIKLARGNSGATTADILSVSSTGAITGATINGGAITSGTAQASTSGTAIDFTGIPSWVKRVTVLTSEVSTTGTSNFLCQLGDSGGLETTGYSGAISIFGSSTLSSITSTGAAGAIILTAGGAADVMHHRFTISLLNPATNLWVISGTYARTDALTGLFTITKSLSATLDRIRITTANGTDTFDAGLINIMYEG